MTTPRPRRTWLAALPAAAALVLAGCADPQQNTGAPSTWAIPSPAAQDAPPAIPTATGTPATTHGSPGTSEPDPTEATDVPPADSPGQDGTSAQPGVQLSNPTFELDNITRTDPTQVAWAYLTHRLTYSHADPGPGVGITQAAQYAATDLAADLRAVGQLATDTWPDVQAAKTVATATITNLATFTTASQTVVIATWTLTVTTARQGPRTTEGLSTTVVLTSGAGGDWQVVTDNLARPD